MGPLAGVKVVEMAGLAPAPFGSMVLADLGAEVIRIDRKGGSFAMVPPPGPLDRGKRVIGIDARDPDEQALLLSIVEHADVFIEGFRPGVAERLGLGPEQLHAINPGLVYGRLTGWGQDGPLALAAGHDINYIALSGALDLVGRAGERPVPPVNLLGDFAGGGLLLALGVIAALYEREKSGQGQVIDAAMVDGSALITAFIHGMRAVGLYGEPRGENALDGGAPFYDTYECADGQCIAVGCVEYPFYQQFLVGLGIEEAGLPFQLDRDGWPQLRKLFTAKIKEKSRDEWAEVFDGTDACVTPVLSPWEADTHPHNASRSMFIEVDRVIQPAPAPRFSRTANQIPAGLESEPAKVRDFLATWGVDTGSEEVVAAPHAGANSSGVTKSEEEAEMMRRLA